MTHRDRAGDPPGRREAAGDAGHRQGFPTPSGGSPARPERRLPKAFGQERVARRCGTSEAARDAARKPWETVSMGHYQRSLVLGGAEGLALAVGDGVEIGDRRLRPAQRAGRVGLRLDLAEGGAERVVEQ